MTISDNASLPPDALHPPDWATVLFRQALAQKLSTPRLTPSLQDILDELGPLPPCTLLIGGCDDGRHLFLDLHDPGAGSLLIVGERGAGKTRLLRAMMASLGLANTIRQVRLALISADNASLRAAAALPHCFKALPPYVDEAARLVESLAELAQQRRQGRQPGPAVMLLLDDLDALLSRLNSDSQELLMWLAQRGPAMQVWVAATVRSQALARLDRKMLQAFGTWLVGAGAFPPMVTNHLSSQLLPPDDLTPGVEFYACLQGNWVKFWIPNSP